MKKSILSLSLIAMMGLGIVSSTTSCKKYEEGPSVSLRTKKARLTGLWMLDREVDSNGNTTTYEGEDLYTTEFKKDGEVEIIVPMGSISVSTKGTWEFSDDKKELITTFGNTTSKDEIILLKNNELGLKDSNGNKTYYIK